MLGFLVAVQMKPRQSEGIILYSRTTHGSATGGNWFVVELAGGDVRYVCVTSAGGEVRALRVAVPRSQSGWHDVAVRRVDSAAAGSHFLRVGNESVTLAVGNAEVPRPPLSFAAAATSAGSGSSGGGNRTRRSFSGDDFIASAAASELFIGGLPRRLYAELPPEVTSRDGFSGCLAAINLNGDARTLRSRGVSLPDQFYNDVIEGCEGQKKINIVYVGPTLRSQQ